jgi:PAS domain S-box-containing protein
MKDQIKILFVEDVHTDAEMIWREISKNKISFEKKLVESKKDYSAAIKSFKPDLIISDYSLPQFDGMHALQIRNEILPDIPFILVTGSVNERVAVDCMKAGADDYILKQNLSRLGEAIKSAIKKRETINKKEIAEKMLRESEEKYRLLVNLSPDAIIVHSGGKILFANEASLKLIGADSFDQIKDIPVLNFVHPDYKDAVRKRLKNLFDTGEPTDYSVEKFINFNNEVVDVEVIGIPVTFMGKPAVQTIVRDISARKKAEEALLESENIFNSFLEYCPVYFFFKDNEAKPIRLSKNFEQMLGRPVNEAIGKSMYELFPSGLAKKMIDDDLNVIKNNVPVKVVEELNRRIFETTKFPIRIKDKQTYLAGFTVDVTERFKAEEALKESEHRFKQIAEIAGEWIWEVDRNGLYTYISKMGEVILGYSADEIVGKMHFYDFFIPEKREEMKAAALAAFKARENIMNFENENLHRDGHVVILETTGVPMIDEKGNLSGYRGVDTDITNRKRANEELIESKERFKTVFDNTLVGLYRTTPDGNILLVNPTLVKMLGFNSVEELLSRNLEEAGFEPSYPRKEFTESMEAKGKVEGLESAWIRKDGSTVFIRESAIAIHDRDGRILFYEGNIEDITEHKEMEEKIIESETYYRTLIDISPDGIFTTDMEGNATYASMKTFEIFGVPPDTKILGTSVLNWVEPEYQRIILERIKDIIAGNVAPVNREYRLLKHDRSVFWGELSSSPIIDGKGNPTGLLVVCRDISERKKAEEELVQALDKAEESDRLKTAFLHNISHEIRTPMNAIVGFSALLGEPNVDKSTHDSYIDIIMKSSNHLLSIISDLIDISNIEANIARISKTAVSLNSLLKSMHQQYLPEANLKKIGLFSVPALSENESVIMADSTKLVQIVSNLITNAMKFTRQGKISFGYLVKEGMIEFFVADTGIGISEENHQKIFDRFFQVEDPVTKIYEGTGLGLAISKAYVKMMGGEIRLSSSPGVGSTFYFTIPFEKPLDTEPATSSYNKESGFAFPEKRKILVAEDIDSNYKLIGYFLSKTNVDLVRVTNGKEAVEKFLEEKDFDLVLMDIKMPVMDGYTATKLIRETNPKIPIIAQTAYADDHLRVKECGFSGFISKPFDKKTLLKIITEFI